MEAVDVLGRIDRGDDSRGVDLRGKRKLDEDSVDRVVAIQPIDQIEQLRLRNRVGKLVREARHPGFGGRLALGADVDGAGGIFSDKDGR